MSDLSLAQSIENNRNLDEHLEQVESGLKVWNGQQLDCLSLFFSQIASEVFAQESNNPNDVAGELINRWNSHAETNIRSIAEAGLPRNITSEEESDLVKLMYNVSDLAVRYNSYNPHTIMSGIATYIDSFIKSR